MCSKVVWCLNIEIWLKPCHVRKNAVSLLQKPMIIKLLATIGRTHLSHPKHKQSFRILIHCDVNLLKHYTHVGYMTINMTAVNLPTLSVLEFVGGMGGRVCM